jgi:Lar family restriction alleviation protein
MEDSNIIPTLLPCPFCGSRDIVKETNYGINETQRRIRCEYCGIATPWTGRIGIGIGLWNRRSGCLYK